ncbi:hypothetical protein EDD22DRAFT_853570 [Suillus occidentalis]|nr:hypothetical protein EDD22DRAFT_853570 [Suillus occidentalis]
MIGGGLLLLWRWAPARGQLLSCTSRPPKLNLRMQQPLRQTQAFNLSGNIINLSLQIEIAGNANQKSEPKKLAGEGKADVEKGLPLAENEEAPPHLLEHSHKELEEESIPTLKERLRLAELACSRLQVQYEKYRLRWLEENHRARILKEYAPAGISTWSPRQIDWNAPSPIQSDDDDGFEDIAGEEIP